MRPTSILATTALTVMVAAGVLAGLAAYFHWGVPAIGALAGTAGLAALVAVALVCCRKKACRTTPSLAENVNKKNMFEFGNGMSERLKSTCQAAILNVSGPLKSQKICIVETKGEAADIYFDFGDGYLQNFQFENYPKGSVLLIHLPGDEYKANIITRPGRLQLLTGAQSKLKNFIECGHEYIALTWKERNELYSNKKFPKRICQMIKE